MNSAGLSDLERAHSRRVHTSLSNAVKGGSQRSLGVACPHMRTEIAQVFSRGRGKCSARTGHKSPDSFSNSHMKAVTSGAGVAKLPMLVLAVLMRTIRALPPIQKLPSSERPFVLIHVVRPHPTYL